MFNNIVYKLFFAGDKRDESKAEGVEANKSEIKENGVSDSAHDLTMSSAGDITIDSVKDHLTKLVLFSFKY